MVQFNFSERTIKAKVVYYGPPQSGKTTNLEQIHRLTDPDGTNRLISLNTAQDRTLFFDLLPFSLGTVSGYDFKIQLYTVPGPGPVQRHATRRSRRRRRGRLRGRQPEGDRPRERDGVREHEGEPAREPPGSREGAARPAVQQAGPRRPAVPRGARPDAELLGPEGLPGGGRARRGRPRHVRRGRAGHARRDRGQVQPQGEGPRPGGRARDRGRGLRGAAAKGATLSGRSSRSRRRPRGRTRGS